MLGSISGVTLAESPGMINYQGYLTNSSGDPLDETVTVTFSLHDTADGTEAARWTSEPYSVLAVQGLINQDFGPVDKQYLEPQPVYLGITVNEEELMPRAALTSTPFVIRDQDTLADLNCANNQVAKWNGTTWICAEDEGGSEGGITGVTAGSGLTGGGTSGNVTLSVANSGITNAMLENNSVNSGKIADGSVSNADIGNGQVVKSVNGIKDNVTIAKGSGINVTTSGNTITVAATGSSGDNLGNHTATQNIKLNAQWLSNDGGSEGLNVNNNGTVTTSGDLNVGDNLQINGDLDMYSSSTNYLEIDPYNSDARFNNPTSGVFRMSDDLVLRYTDTSSWRDLYAGEVRAYDYVKFFNSSEEQVGYFYGNGSNVVYSGSGSSGILEIWEPLHVKGANDVYMTMGSSPTSNYRIEFSEYGSSGLDIDLGAGLGGSKKGVLMLHGSLAIGDGGISVEESVGITRNLTVSGHAYKNGGGTWEDLSDRRLKMNIQTLSGVDALNKITQLQGVTYEWRNPEEHNANGPRAGIIAQDLEAVFPDWVTETKPEGKDKELIPENEKAKAVSFPHDFNAYLIEAIKALKAENDALKSLVCQDHPEAEICL
jgi:hypothetical protein